MKFVAMGRETAHSCLMISLKRPLTSDAQSLQSCRPKNKIGLLLVQESVGVTQKRALAFRFFSKLVFIN